MTPRTISGDCIACRRYHEQLFRWVLHLWGDRWWLWLCQSCRDMDRELLTETVKRNLETAPILDAEPPFPAEMFGPKCERERHVYR